METLLYAPPKNLEEPPVKRAGQQTHQGVEKQVMAVAVKFQQVASDLRPGESLMPIHPKPGPPQLHGPDEFKGAGGGMDVPRSHPGPHTVALAGEAEPRREAVLGKMAVVRHPSRLPWAGSSLESRSMIRRRLFFLLNRASVDRGKVASRTPWFANYSSLYHIVRLSPSFFCRIIQAETGVG